VGAVASSDGNANHNDNSSEEFHFDCKTVEQINSKGFSDTSLTNLQRLFGVSRYIGLLLLPINLGKPLKLDFCGASDGRVE